MNCTYFRPASRRRSPRGQSLLAALGFALIVSLLFVLSGPLFSAEEKNVPAQNANGVADAAGLVRLIPVPLPITGTVDTQVIQIVDRLIAELPESGKRPLFVFEFQARDSELGAGSQFERSFALARFLAGERLSRIRTVAFIPRGLQGHAVLPALACEEIILAPDADFGAAGKGERFIDPTVRRGYSEIAERRRVFPTAFVIGMLDKNAGVFKVQTTDETRYVLAEELDELKKRAAVTSVDRIVPEGEMGRFSGRDLRLKFGFASHLASDRAELAAALQVSPQAFLGDPSLGKGWRAVQVELRGPLHANATNWIARSLKGRLDAGDINLICVVIDSPGGSLDSALMLANLLAAQDSASVRTVAFVPREARGEASLIALACDHLVMKEDALLGGPGTNTLEQRDLKSLRESVAELARKKQRDWSLPVALVDSNLVVHRYVRQGTGRTRLWTADELTEQMDAAAWERGEEIATAAGLSGREADNLQLVHFLADTVEEMRRLYHLDREPELLQPNWAHNFIEGLASPRITGMLLFVAFFALMIEFMTPGFTGAGFVSGVCFLLFFWSHVLHGTAGWLEVLLFLAGAACVAIEILAMPGLGILGFGGGAMMIAAIVLASQTFVVPRNSYQLEQLPTSLYTMVAGICGAVLSLVLMRRYIPRAPMLRRLMLEVPEVSELRQRESLTHFENLIGQEGKATTKLAPAGKAQFGEQLVNVITECELVESGSLVEVVEVRGNHVVVRPKPAGRQ